MRKLITLLLFTVFYNYLYSQSGDYRVKYDLKYQIDSTNTANIQNEIMYLDIEKNGKSYFRPESIFLKDSILQSKNPQSLFSINKPKFNYCIVKNDKNTSVNTFYDYTAFKFKVLDNIKLIWNINNGSSKKILGYETKMATTTYRGRNYTAWYAVDVPINNGPYKFSGLPGLILEIYDSKKHYVFKVLSINKLKDVKSYINQQEYRLITTKEFSEFKEKVKKKPSLILYNPGIQLPKAGLDKYDRSHRERNKHKNNPIELNKSE